MFPQIHSLTAFSAPQFGVATRKPKKMTERQQLEHEHAQLIKAEKLYYGLLEIMVNQNGPLEKQRQLAGWLADHENRRNELHALLFNPKALPKAHRDVNYAPAGAARWAPKKYCCTPSL